MSTNTMINNTDMPDYLQNVVISLFQDVPDYVQRAFFKVRATNKVNMFDSSGVLKIMNELGDFDAILWLADFNRSTKYILADSVKYMKLLDVVSMAFKNEFSITEEIDSITEEIDDMDIL